MLSLEDFGGQTSKMFESSLLNVLMFFSAPLHVLSVDLSSN